MDFNAVATANIDSDPTIDRWVVSSETLDYGTDRVIAGVPYNSIDDVSN